jgi:hypothetical protein
MDGQRCKLILFFRISLSSWTKKNPSSYELINFDGAIKKKDEVCRNAEIVQL